MSSSRVKGLIYSSIELSVFTIVPEYLNVQTVLLLYLCRQGGLFIRYNIDIWFYCSLLLIQHFAPNVWVCRRCQLRSVLSVPSIYVVCALAKHLWRANVSLIMSVRLSACNNETITTCLLAHNTSFKVSINSNMTLRFLQGKLALPAYWSPYGSIIQIICCMQ